MRHPTQATPHSRAISTAVSAARATTRWPIPLSPSTSAVPGALRSTVILGRGLVDPSLSLCTYCGKRKTPCASAPTRSASSISSAILAASPFGTPTLTIASPIRPVTALVGIRTPLLAWTFLLSPTKLGRAYSESSPCRHLRFSGHARALHSPSCPCHTDSRYPA